MDDIEIVTASDAMILGLFEATGIELEYMIVDNDLNVAPLVPDLFTKVNGSITDQIALDGEIAWSNELVAHVLELKTDGPAASLSSLASNFTRHIKQINQDLERMEAKLMPTAAHPWMNPETDTVLWPNGQRDIYQAYNSIFNCQGHGWSNLQSMHINLPFANESEFVLLHNAIRLILPLLPSLTASSPILDSELFPWKNARLWHYQYNQKRIPEITGKIIPEWVGSIADYEHIILEPMYRAIAPFDPQGILREPWLNSRGVIPKFDCHALEIRIVDNQETPYADIAIAALIVAVLQDVIRAQPDLLIREYIATDALAEILHDNAKYTGDALLSDQRLLHILGFTDLTLSMQEVWQGLLARYAEELTDYYPVLQAITQQGSLADRILKATSGDLRRPHLRSIYSELAECLDEGRLFIP